MIIKILLAFLFIRGVRNIVFNEIPDESQSVKYFANLISKFKGYQIIFHTETTSLEYINQIIKLLTYSSNHTLMNMLVYNYDNFAFDDFERPLVSRAVNIILRYQESLWDSLAKPEKVKATDVVLFISRNDGFKKFVSQGMNSFLKLAGNVLFGETTKHRVSLYKICYYCGYNSKQFDLLEISEDSSVKTNVKNLQANDFMNLKGHLLFTTFVSYFPYVICKESSIVSYRKSGNKTQFQCLHIDGVEGELIRTLSKKLNFTFVVLMMEEDSSFLSMIKKVNSSGADIAFGGISMTADRLAFVQYTKQYNFEDFNLLFMFELTFAEIFMKFIEIFNAAIVWSLYGLSFVILSCFLYVAIQIGKSKRKNTLLDSFWALLHMILEQSNPDLQPYYQSRLTNAIILSLWWWASLILCNVYKGAVLSSVVSPPNLEPENIRDLVTAGYRIAGNIQMADIIRDLLHVQDPLYMEAYKKTMYGDNTCEVFQMVLNNHGAMLDEVSTLQYEIKDTCPKPDDTKYSLLRIGTKALRTTGHAWALQKGAPYRQAIDNYMSWILSGGFLKKWTKDVTVKLASSSIPKSRQVKSNEVQRLSVKRFLPILVIYSAGIAVSVLWLILEILYKYCCSRKKSAWKKTYLY